MLFGKRRTYLDYAAGVTGNPSSPHEEGRRAKQMLEDARKAIARLVGVQPDDVIFTSGATEANALALLGHMRSLKAAGRNNLHMLYLPSAHASVVENAEILAREGVSVEALPIKNYHVDCEALARMLRPETALVSMDAVCGETGVVWNTREVADTLRKFAAGKHFSSSFEAGQPVASKSISPLLHVDASQAPLTEKILRTHFDADMMTLDASKVGATRGIGALIAHQTIPLVPLYGGGGQERGVRPGSEAPELAEKFAAALGTVTAHQESFRENAEREREQLIKTIMATIPNVFVQKGRIQAPHILNLSLPGRDTDYLVALLDEAGFIVSTRSACETDSEEGSRAVLALTEDKERATSTLRISWGPGIRSSDLSRFSSALARAIAFLDSSNAR